MFKIGVCMATGTCGTGGGSTAPAPTLDEPAAPAKTFNMRGPSGQTLRKNHQCDWIQPAPSKLVDRMEQWTPV